MSNLKVLEIFVNAKDSISTTPAAKKRMKIRYKMQLWKLLVLENLYQIDKEISKRKLHYREYSLDSGEYSLFPILEKWLLSQRSEERRHIMYYPGDLESIIKTVGVTSKQFITHHINFCIQNLADLREVIKCLKQNWKDSTKSQVAPETRQGETDNSEPYHHPVQNCIKNDIS